MQNTTSLRCSAVVSHESTAAEGPTTSPDTVQRTVAPASTPPVALAPAGTIVVWKRYSELTGGPQVAVRFQMAEPTYNREYVFDVTTAEAVADQILIVCDQHRADFDAEWFVDQPTVQR